MHEGHKSRNEQSSYEIDQDRVTRDVAYIASKLPGDDGACSCGGAYHAEHGSFKHDTHRAMGHGDEQTAYADKKTGLQQQDPEMPASQAQIAGIDAAERQIEHRENEDRLDNADTLSHDAMERSRNGQTDVDKITEHAKQNGENQRPFLQKTDEFH